MAASHKTLTFKRLKFLNPYPVLLRAYTKDARKLPEREAAFTYRRARSIMKKGPKKPKSRFGNYRMYSQSTYLRRQKRLAGTGQLTKPGWWKKGLYSRPGQPPFYHGGSKDFNLRSIRFSKVNPQISHARSTGAIYAWRVGPVYKPSKIATPVPQLQEFGGTVTLRHARGKKSFTTKGLKQTHIKTNTGQTLRYPPRPYMAPASKEARESAARKSPHTLKAFTKMGGMKGKRIY